MITINCKECNNAIHISEDRENFCCNYCGTKFSLIYSDFTGEIIDFQIIDEPDIEEVQDEIGFPIKSYNNIEIEHEKEPECNDTFYNQSDIKDENLKRNRTDYLKKKYYLSKNNNLYIFKSYLYLGTPILVIILSILNHIGVVSLELVSLVACIMIIFLLIILRVQ